MVLKKSLDEVNLIAALLHDVQQTSHGVVLFDTRALNNTINIVLRRTRLEGLGFLTKALPRLGKALDKALSGHTPLNASSHCFPSLKVNGEMSKLPRFLGEFFIRVCHPDGTVLPTPCAKCVSVLRQILYLFYKYELPYTDEQEQKVINQFVKTEDDLIEHARILQDLSCRLAEPQPRRCRDNNAPTPVQVAREARILLNRVFQSFDLRDIYPRHGPGAVATGQRLWDKYLWTNVSDRITSVYPLDEYFYSSLGSVCDNYKRFSTVSGKDLPARVVLVPKDSRGPRLISKEPVDFQWIQQGLASAIVRHVEHLETTRFNVFFTDQGPNQRGALLGSKLGTYSTLDLNEASDRVSLGLVRLLFPSHVYTYLEACRSLSTELPNGKNIVLHKYAPMGSALCFPVLALTVWAILTAGAPNADTREGILVYGDDVIVPTAYPENAMKHLESFGLKINRDKSCINGLFRESCGMDAFMGICVTPVRIRTVWSSSPSPESYTSWISYANSFFSKKYYNVYNYIVEALSLVYKEIPDKSMNLSCPSLESVPESIRPKRKRVNYNLQRLQYYVYDVKAPLIRKSINGWSMLLRWFTEGNKAYPSVRSQWSKDDVLSHPFSVGQYTKRRSSMLVRRWR
jgi:hypothetical protein